MMTSALLKSPEIIVLKWGRMEVEGIGSGRDFKLWPGGGRNWDWKETGTGHSPGIQVDDCKELVEKRCNCVVLGRGVFKRLKVTEKALSYLEQHNIRVICSGTKKAVREYNQLVHMGEKVGGLFHTTC